MLANRLFSSRVRPFSSAVRPSSNSRRTVVQTKAMLGGMSPEVIQKAMQDPKMRAAMEEAMKNPAFMEQVKQMQAAMQNPETQRQIAQMQQFMQNKQLQERMKSLKDDPEFAEVFADIQKNGQGALMKYMNDDEFLVKLNSKIGDVVPVAAAAAAGPAAGAPEAGVEINDLLDAARYGDLEAVEDFLAIGKDANMKDAENRTPLHYACAYAHGEIARLLLESGADMENTDSKGNTPLHYAAGYGRPALARMMIDVGANKAAKNSTGKTPIDLVLAAPQNPINNEADLMEKLKP